MNTSLTSPRPIRRRRAPLAGVALATAGVLVALSVPSAATAADGDAVIDIYDVNDFHGRISQSLNTPPRDGDAAGAAVLAGALQQLRGSDRSTSAFVSVGDNIGASTFESFIQQDQPTIDVLNDMDLSVSALGNHEFDKGRADLTDRVIGPDDQRNAKWDYVSANVLDRATGKPAFDAYSIKTISGKRVGFIGATVNLDGLVTPSGIASLQMADITTSVNAVAEQLTDGETDNDEADVLVLLVHDGAESATAAGIGPDTAFGGIARGVSPKVAAILSGHTHQTYVHEIAPTGTTKTRPVVQTGSYGYNLGHLRLTVAADGTVDAHAENIPLVTGAYPADAAVAAKVQAAVTKADELGSVELGTIDQAMRRAVQSNGSENRGGESTLGNFVAEVQRTATQRQGSQIAFMNPGGLRQDMAAGTVTYKQAAVVQPFANTLVVLDLTGAQVREALEQQWQPGANRPFLKLGASKGFSYTYDPDAPKGSHVTQVFLNGTELDPAATYRVTVNSFLASGGDGFTAFDEAAKKADSGQVDLEAQVRYFDADPAVRVATDQRSVGVQVTPTPEGGFRPGDEVTVRLSSLTFSSAEGQGGVIRVSAGGTVLGEGTIDTTVVDTTDEQGRATVTFPVPGGTTATPAATTPASTTPASTTPAATTRTAATPAAAVTPAATTEEPLVVTLPNGQSITLAVTIPVAAAVDPTPGDPTPGDPTPGDGVPGTGNGTGGAGDGGSGTGTGTGGTTSAGGDLAWTGAELAWPAAAAGLLLLAGLTAMVVVRRKRAQDDAGLPTDA